LLSFPTRRSSDLDDVFPADYFVLGSPPGKLAGRTTNVRCHIRFDLSDTGTVLRPTRLLRELSLVFCLNSLQETGSVLSAADHFLEFRCPSLCENRACGVGDKVHRCARFADNHSSRERLVSDGAF